MTGRSVGMGQRSVEARRRSKADDFLFDEAAKGGRGLVTTACGDGLVADWQPRLGETGRAHRRRQIHKARITCPEELIGRCDRIAVDRDLALPALALLVVRPSGGSRSRAEQNVPVRKKCRKGAPQPMPLVVKLQHRKRRGCRCSGWNGPNSQLCGSRRARMARLRRVLALLRLVKSFAVDRTKANVNPPAPVPQITGADT